LVGMPDPAADVDLARLEVEVAAARMDLGGVRSGARVIAGRRGFTGPREASAKVRLVRRLVLRESDVAVDPERALPGVRAEGDPALLELLAERRDQRLERLLEQPLVLRLSRLKPGPLIVGCQVDEELDRLRAEAGE